MDRTALVFVHGILSSARIWSAFTSLIEADQELATFDVRPFEYESPLTRWWPGRRIPNVDLVAGSLGTFLAHDLAKYHRIVLVAHSQGGLVVQSYLHKVLSDGRGHELARVRLIVLLACPNDGSQFLAPLRWVTRILLRNPQEKDLLPLNDRIIDARRTVLNKVVPAAAVSTHSCHIPVFAYAGESDGIVSPQSAASVFPRTGVLPGDHSTIIQPDSAQHRAFVTLKHHLLHDLVARDES
jgi:pimeloyl-ACP methyl ester carboxylesterase